jgi:hypothetical protein
MGRRGRSARRPGSARGRRNQEPSERLSTVPRPAAQHKTKTALAVLAIAGGGLAYGPQSAQTARVRWAHRWTFRALHVRSAEYGRRAGFGDRSFSFTSPQKRSVLRRGWWVLRLHFVMQTDRRQPSGRSYLEGTCNGIGCVLVSVRLRRVHGKPQVSFDSSSGLDGVAMKKVEPDLYEGTFSNFFPAVGVLPGRNTIKVGVSQKESHVVSRLKILDSSTIAHTPYGPPHLQISEKAPSKTEVGRVVRIHARVRNIGDRAARKVTVSIDCPASCHIAFRRSARIGVVRARSSRTFLFFVTFHRPGSFPIGLTAAGASNQAATLRYIRVLR